MRFVIFVTFFSGLLGCNDSSPTPEETRSESSDVPASASTEETALPESPSVDVPPKSGAVSSDTASAENQIPTGIQEFLQLHESLFRFKEPTWDATVEALKSKGVPYTLTLIDEISFPIGKQSLDDPKVDEQLMKLDALGKAIYKRIPSGQLTVQDVRSILEANAVAALTSHALEESLWMWTLDHLTTLAANPEFQAELKGLQDSYQGKFSLSSSDDPSKSVATLVPDYAEKILSR